jgi:single-strand selective monofunctional uracil DNA glycosylase
MTIQKITDQLVKELKPLSFKSPVTHVYNPLHYSRKSYDVYFEKYGKGSKEILLLGMNPGPFGMVQTGVPFGEVEAVKKWLQIEEAVGHPEDSHPKRPVMGFECQRSEVSGRRVWGWAEDRFGNPQSFFKRFMVLNYCPLVFIEESGKNRTPDKLPKSEREALFKSCDKALKETVHLFAPKHVIGVGAFAEKRAHDVLKGMEVTIGRITHPSPANPKANKGWTECIENEFAAMGIQLRA